MSLERMELQFARSGHVQMFFRIRFIRTAASRRSCRCLHWELLKTRHARFFSGSVYVSGKNYRRNHDCLDTLMNMDLPSLRTLSLEFYTGLDWDDFEEFKWTMPALQVLECRSEEATYLPLSLPLKHLILSAGNDAYHDSWREKECVRYIGRPEIASITSLTLNFPSGGAFEYESGRAEFGVDVELNNLEALAVQLGHAYYNLNDADLEFLCRLNVPNLERLQLRCGPDINDEETFWFWMERLACQPLETVDVIFADEYYTFTEYDDWEVFRRKLLDCFPGRPILCDGELRPSDVDASQYSEDSEEETQYHIRLGGKGT